MKKTLQKTGELLLRLILGLHSLLPLPVHYFFARILAFLVEKVFRYRTGLVKDNLEHAFPGKDAAWISSVAKAFYRHFANIVVEAIWFGGCRDSRRLRRSRIVSLRNPELLDKAYSESPSVMVMYTHTGNWELIGGLEFYNYTSSPYPLTERNSCTVYRKQSSEVWDNILRDNRFAPLNDKGAFEGYLESRSLVRYAFTHRSEKKIYCVNTDQKPYFSAPDYIKVKFLNRECNAMSGAAALAVKFHMAVLYQRMMENPGGKGYTIEYVPLCEDASLHTVEEIVERYFRLLEEDIKAQPHNYLWTHNRWWMG